MKCLLIFLTLFAFLSFVFCSSADEKFRWNNQGNISSYNAPGTFCLVLYCLHSALLTVHLTGAATGKNKQTKKNIMHQQHIDTILYKNYENAQSNSLHCNKGLKKGLFWQKPPVSHIPPAVLTPSDSWVKVKQHLQIILSVPSNLFWEPHGKCFP